MTYYEKLTKLRKATEQFDKALEALLSDKPLRGQEERRALADELRTTVREIDAMQQPQDETFWRASLSFHRHSALAFRVLMGYAERQIDDMQKREGTGIDDSLRLNLLRLVAECDEQLVELTSDCPGSIAGAIHAVWRTVAPAAKDVNKYAFDLEHETRRQRWHIEQMEARLRVLGKDPARIDVTKVPIGTTFGKWRIEKINAPGYDGGDILIEDIRDGFGGFHLPVEFVQSLADAGLEFVLPVAKERTE